MTWLGYTVKRAQVLKIKAEVSSIWAKGCILMTVCVLSDLTSLPLLGVGRKSWYIIIITIIKISNSDTSATENKKKKQSIINLSLKYIQHAIMKH